MPKTATARIVYVVDADESVREGLARLVRSAGLDARPCAAIDAIRREGSSERAACAVVDVSELLWREPATQTGLRSLAAAIPVIAVSARDDPTTRRLARELGAQAFFRKPVDAAALLDSIDWVTRAEPPADPD